MEPGKKRAVHLKDNCHVQGDLFVPPDIDLRFGTLTVTGGSVIVEGALTGAHLIHFPSGQPTDPARMVLAQFQNVNFHSDDSSLMIRNGVMTVVTRP